MYMYTGKPVLNGHPLLSRHLSKSQKLFLLILILNSIKINDYL